MVYSPTLIPYTSTIHVGKCAIHGFYGIEIFCKLCRFLGSSFSLRQSPRKYKNCRLLEWIKTIKRKRHNFFGHPNAFAKSSGNKSHAHAVCEGSFAATLKVENLVKRV